MPAHVHTPAVLITICSKMVTDAGGQTMEAEGATLLQGVDELPWMGSLSKGGRQPIDLAPGFLQRWLQC